MEFVVDRTKYFAIWFLQKPSTLPRKPNKISFENSSQICKSFVNIDYLMTDAPVLKQLKANSYQFTQPFVDEL